MTKNAPMIFDTGSRLDPVSSICDVIKEHQRLKTVRAELKNDARKHEEDMATERKRIDFAMAELDSDVRKHKENMDFAREQLDAQVRLAEQQLKANEQKLCAHLESCEEVIKQGAASQEKMRTAMEVITELLRDNSLGSEVYTTLVDKVLEMADKLNQAHDRTGRKWKMEDFAESVAWTMEHQAQGNPPIRQLHAQLTRVGIDEQPLFVACEVFAERAGTAKGGECLK